MQNNKYNLTKYACYIAYLATACVFSMPSLLFVTFREIYGISYTLLGTLVLVNFFTQMSIDLFFTFFAKYFNIRKTIRTMPVITALGMFIYALGPMMFPENAYLWLVIGTAVFSVASGLGEVFLSPLMAAIPSETPDRDMSTLHSLFAYGLVMVVIVTTLMLKTIGSENWMFIPMLWGCVQVAPFIMFCISPIPDMNVSSGGLMTKGGKKTGFLLLCVLCIFLGSAAENVMMNWVSGFMERALLIPKVAGDILGLALFGVLLGLSRTIYAKYGKNIVNVLTWSMAGAIVCYLGVSFSQSVYLSAFFCVITGACTAMVWPGSLILMEEKLPGVGVAAYALMAAGGDLGGSVAPQLMGIIVDKVSASPIASRIGASLSITAEQVGMKAGMLVSTVFPVLGLILLIYIRKLTKKEI